MDDQSAAPPSPDLSSCVRAKTLRLTTQGRRSGKRRVVEIWFVIEGDRVYVQAGPNGEKGWYGNLLKNPSVSLTIDGHLFQGRAAALLDPMDVERVLGLFRRKYWLARLSGLLGLSIGHGKPVAIDVEVSSTSA